MDGADDSPTEQLVVEPGAAPARPVAAPARPAARGAGLIGRALGKLTIVEHLGRGGSGDVYRAEQPQLGRSAVIKVLRPDVAASANRIERFLREAKLASRLDHPYAAHVYAFGAEPDGLLWIAMEHVRGLTLDELVARRGPMPPALFGPLFARLCEVVHTAHELGIVHRDIKGGNVMVIERAGQLLPKLLDFGIAKDGEAGLALAGGAGDGELTEDGSTLGSPQYMAPEQWEAPADVDARADVYALGVLAYQCVSGQLPFRGVARAELPRAHLTRPPPRLPDAVPEAIAGVIERALAKRPDARWRDALAFGEAMRGAVGGGVPEAVPVLDAATRDAWVRGGPQPLADAIARLARAATTVEADAALRELVAITCRWLAVLALARLRDASGGAAAPPSDGALREHARAVVGRDDGAPWLALARAAAAAAPGLAGLDAALADTRALAALADRLDDRGRARTAAALAADVDDAAAALRPLEPLLAYHLVVGRAGGAESWQGVRRRDRERVVVWGEPLADGVVALLDAVGRVVAVLSPLAQVAAPMPSAEPELFLLWRSGRSSARLVAAPWGFERDDEEAGHRLAALTTEDSDTLADAAGERSPYPGLAPYGVADAERFVGREREVEALANRMVRAPLLAVLGPSGAGKSSFIHAGLLPRLAETYELVTMRPGRHPLRALAALPPIGGDPRAPDDLAARLRALGERAPRGLVVVVDQLEELVTLCADPGERRAFAETLARAADGPGAPVRVVVTCRDDFAATIESEDALRGRFEVFVLATPSADALRRIVTEPARRAGVAIDREVVDDMVATVAGRPASLPLLSFTAAQLWATRDRAAQRITHAAYLALGGVAGALSAYADQVYGSLARRDQDVARALFARLVASDGTRIPAPRAELEQLPGARGVLAHLIDARLLVVRDGDGDGGGGDGDVVELVHECLAARWTRLVRWRSEDAADRALLGDVRAAARRWHDAGERPDLVWRGVALAELTRLAARATSLTDTERRFTEASQRAERRARRARRALVAGAMAALAAVAVVMASLGVDARRAAALAEERLTASLIAQGRRELNDGRALPALAYFAEALGRGADTPALRFMIAVAARAWPFEVVPAGGAAMTAVAHAPGWIAAADGHGGLRFWDADGRPRGQLATELGGIAELRRTADDRLLVAGARGAALIDPPGGPPGGPPGAGAAPAIRARLAGGRAVLGAHAGPGPDEITVLEPAAIRVYGLDGAVRRERAAGLLDARNAVFTAGGRYLAISDAGTVELVDLAALTARTIARDTDGASASADGSRLGYIDKDGVAHVLAGDGAALRTFKPRSRATWLHFSPTGDRVAAVSEHDLAIHDGAGELLAVVPVKGMLTAVELRGDDAWIAGTDGVLLRHRRGALAASLPTHLGELDALELTDRLAVSIGSDGRLAMTRLDAAHLDETPLACERPSYHAEGIATIYACDARHHVVAGRTRLAAVDTRERTAIAVHAPSQRGAIAGGGITVYGPGGVTVATAGAAEVTALAFESAAHLIVAQREPARVRRWAIDAGRWDDLDAGTEVLSATVAAGGVFLGAADGAIVQLAEGRRTVHPGIGRAIYLTASGDGRRVAAALGDGATVILDGATGAVRRRLEPAGALGAAPVFDHAGELLIRSGRGSLMVVDGATGDALVHDLDLLRHALSARWDADGRIEVAGHEIGVLAIARERRPAAELRREIACRVPLRVVDGKLEPAPPGAPGCAGATRDAP